jgi:hypothetical protein
MITIKQRGEARDGAHATLTAHSPDHPQQPGKKDRTGDSSITQVRIRKPGHTSKTPSFTTQGKAPWARREFEVRRPG